MPGFGGAVKLTGESEYRKALQQITQNLREMSAEMKTVSSMYDKNDNSVNAIRSRYSVLTRTLAEQQERLRLLKSEYERMNGVFQQQEQKHRQLVASYEEEKNKLASMSAIQNTTTKAYKDQEAKVKELANAVNSSARSCEYNAEQMSKMRVQISNAETDCNNTARAVDDLGKETEESGKEASQAGTGGWTIFKDIIANLATQVITSAIKGMQKLGSAVIDVGKQALDAYGEYEQMVGGVKKIFGDELGQQVIENAHKAFATAGVSANEYMQNVTRFSASLLQDMGDNTAEAAKYADMAMKDMADNANTFGTDLASIQNAYQGFAKDNYTMLDNLRLGYGGTAGEMARLINETKVLGETAEEVDAKTVKTVPLYKMIEAIHIVQQQLNITGTTAMEASSTMTGATGAMKAAWTNLLTGMVSETSDFDQLVSDFVSTLTDGNGGGFLGVLVPRITSVVKGLAASMEILIPQLLDLVSTLIADNMPQLISAVSSGIEMLLKLLPTIVTELSKQLPTMLKQIVGSLTKLLPMLLETLLTILKDNLPILIDAVFDGLQTILDKLPDVVQILVDLIPSLVSQLLNMLPQLIDVGLKMVVALINGITAAIPQLIAMLPKLIKDIINTIVANLPAILQAGMELIRALLLGIMEALPELISYLPELVETIVGTILDNLPMLLEAAVEIIIALIDGLVENLPLLVETVPKIIWAIASTLIDHLPELIDSGTRIVNALIEGIGKHLAPLGAKAKEIASTVIGKIKTLPEDALNLGKKIVQGVWEGISKSAKWLKDKITGWVGDITDFIKDLFGIHSPSTLFRDEIGENLALGVGEGFTDSMRTVASDMADAIPTRFSVDSTPAASASVTAVRSFDDMVDAFKDALAQMKIELDDDEVGRFVDRTVTRLVYE